MERQEASYTVELSLLIPVILFVLFAPVYKSFEMSRETQQVSACGFDEAFCAEEKVRKIKAAEHILEDLK